VKTKYRVIEEGGLFYPQKKTFLFWSYIPNIEFWLDKVGCVYWHYYQPQVQAMCFSYAEAIRIIEKDTHRSIKPKRIIHDAI
jgi:hypothetical protein